MKVEWYYQVMGDVAGPFTSSELRQLAQTGRLQPDYLVRMGKEGSWVLAEGVTGLFDVPKSGGTIHIPATNKPTTPLQENPANTSAPRSNREINETDHPQTESIPQRKRHIGGILIVVCISLFVAFLVFSRNSERADDSRRIRKLEQEWNQLDLETDLLEIRRESLLKSRESGYDRAISSQLVKNFEEMFRKLNRMEEITDELERIRAKYK